MPPGLDGYDLAHALRELETDNLDRKATPTIMISGDAMMPSRKRRFADFQVYMPKPFDRMRLVHVVERLVEADSEAVKAGSLGGWEAQQAIEAAVVATEVAAVATAAAVEATMSAANATTAAIDATESAQKAKSTAAKAEVDAKAASANAPANHY
jgi:CheY-like chemotaxis protein